MALAEINIFANLFVNILVIHFSKPLELFRDVTHILKNKNKNNISTHWWNAPYGWTHFDYMQQWDLKKKKTEMMKQLQINHPRKLIASFITFIMMLMLACGTNFILNNLDALVSS